MAPSADRGQRERRWRALALVASALALGCAALAFWALGRAREEPVAIAIAGTRPGPAPPLPDQLELAPASFADLAGWSADALADVLPALVRSCAGGPRGGAAWTEALAAARPAWDAFCATAAKLPRGDRDALAALVERELVPWAIANHGERRGLLTGYYEPELRGSRRRQGAFVHPLYLAPRDAQVVDLGEFHRDLAGRKITGILRSGRFRPYWDRSEIEAGALHGRGLEFLWVDDPVALFFLQIQGSGRVTLSDGTVVRVGYAAQNGHDYTPIGRVLVERGALVQEEVSLQSIRAWLRANPAEAERVMDANRSYVFFRVLPGTGPEGAAGVELTAGRSLAVDDAYLPYGVPLWIESTFPAAPELARGETPLARLAIAQDKGGAIRGPVRADLFLGPGAEAEALAGRMKQPLRLWLLWPRGSAPPRAIPPP
ncbi:MAG: MltA domain-containing protein [Thermoanaerobaculia bacterium]